MKESYFLPIERGKFSLLGRFSCTVHVKSPYLILPWALTGYEATTLRKVKTSIGHSSPYWLSQVGPAGKRKWWTFSILFQPARAIYCYYFGICCEEFWKKDLCGGEMERKIRTKESTIYLQHNSPRPFLLLSLMRIFSYMRDIPHASSHPSFDVESQHFLIVKSTLQLISALTNFGLQVERYVKITKLLNCILISVCILQIIRYSLAIKKYVDWLGVT